MITLYGEKNRFSKYYGHLCKYNVMANIINYGQRFNAYCVVFNGITYKSNYFLLSTFKDMPIFCPIIYIFVYDP